MKWFLVISVLLHFFLICSFPLYAEGVVRINEVFVHPDSGNNEWVELYNPQKIDLTGYWIDDDVDFIEDGGGSAKKQLTSLNESDYVVFEISASMFNNGGDAVVLFDSQGTIIDQYQYSQDPGSGISIGRSPDSTGEFAILLSSTKGSTNSTIRPSPTPIPPETPTPTRTPTPTLLPTSTKAPTATKAPSPTKIVTATPTKKVIPTIVKKRTASGSATVLAASTTATRDMINKAEKKIFVKSVEQHTWARFIPIILGVILLLACGILSFLKLRNRDV